MQRTKTKPKEGQILFVKTGGGNLRLADGRIVRKGETFYAYPEDVPQAFRDTVKPKDPELEKSLEEHGVVQESKPKFFIKDHGNYWYDVVNKDGKVLNEKRLRKKDAEQLLKDLEG